MAASKLRINVSQPSSSCPKTLQPLKITGNPPPVGQAPYRHHLYKIRARTSRIIRNNAATNAGFTVDFFSCTGFSDKCLGFQALPHFIQITSRSLSSLKLGGNPIPQVRNVLPPAVGFAAFLLSIAICSDPHLGHFTSAVTSTNL
jgi:hypothetical protein